MAASREVPSMASLVIIFTLTLLMCLPAGISGKSKPISVNLNAKWSSSPLILEASEFLAKESNDQFWTFVNGVGDVSPESIDTDHEESMYQLAIKLAGQQLSPVQLKLLKFALSLRAHSPAVEMFHVIAKERKPPKECEAFVDVHSMITCDINAMKAFLKLAQNQPKPAIIKSDHHYPGTEARPVTVILYAELGKPSFHKLHNSLRELAEKGEINYILRHYIKEPSELQVRLSGYGVELAIKSTEYKAKDDTKVEDGGSKEGDQEEEEMQGFIFSELKQLYPELRDNLDKFKQHLIDNDQEMAPLKVWQMQDLSFQAAQKVLSAPVEEQLGILRDVSQNFPTRSRSLVRVGVKEEMRKEIGKNQKILEESFGLYAGDSALFINGLQADLEIYDVFTLLDTLRSEAKLMQGLHTMGVKGELLTNLMKLDLRGGDTNYAVDVRDDTVVYVNNLEKDRKYAGWPGSVQDLLRPTFPGMLRHVRRNLYHLVFFVNPADSSAINLLKLAEAFYVHNAPARIGVVLVVNKDLNANGYTDAGVAMLRAFNYITREHSPVKGLSFLTDVYERVEGEEEITADLVRDEFSSTYPNTDIEDVFGPDSEYDMRRQDAVDFYERTGLGELPQVLMNGIPMKQGDLEQDSFEEAAVTAILKATPEIQKAVFNGKLKDDMDVLEFLMTQNNVMPRLNARVLNPSESFLDLTKEVAPGLLSNPDAYAGLPSVDMTGALMSSMKYLTKKDEAALRPVTNWLVGDLETPVGRQLVYDAIKQMKHSNDVRLGIIHNPTTLPNKDDPSSHFISKAIHVALNTLDRGIAKSFVTKLLKEENVEALKSGEKTLADLEVNKMDVESYKKSLEEASVSFLTSYRSFCEKVLGLRPGERSIISNGKVIGPLKTDETFIQEDFSLLEKYTKTSALKIKDKISPMGLDEEKGSDGVMRTAALLMSVPQKEGRKEVEFPKEKHSVLKITAPETDSPAFDVVAILDPATRAAQKYTPLIMVLQEVVNVNVKIFMNCREKLSDIPLKSFYRYVLEPEVTFAVDSKLSSGPSARFNDMPQKPLLTLGMDPPESWLVESVVSPYDLDNIYLAEVESFVHADFELEYLLLEGHCYDSATGQPPRGLQFILGTNTTHAVMDTIVMANLGYFQLKATPGAWILRLRQGRSFEIYDIISHEYTDSPPSSPEVIVVIDSFKSKIIKVRVNKKPGMEMEDLLGESDDGGNGGIWDSISSQFTGTGSSNNGEKETQSDTLNIFSVASGHLYERFLRIMMLSVLKHTELKVKFWFLKNYLSPTFKATIPYMAKEYGFEYELIQYKWPRWLHQQTEKQRVIWGYKILFLDVLFPLDVQKIIFVDADQIVRADLKELNELDLEGAPYGYTPFCDSRKEMDGFRFWKSGYWNSHLAGRRYHISALYVVDLKKFRKIAAGDRLRGQYQGLSQDPNSLSNLDQDLPNNMIHQVAIKSLPQEWLWCETWCSDDELKRAKTIDLCNNPLTKEPKLSAAARIVPEWTDYDNEARKFIDGIVIADSESKSSTSSSSSQTDKNKDERDEL